MGAAGDEAAVPALLRALKDADASVRAAAALALMQVADESAVPWLRDATGDADPRVRAAAERAVKALMGDE
jgi:HEAT repeat protein